jgi:hypothetical protein
MVSEQNVEIQLIVRTNCQTELRLSHRSVALVDYRYSVQEDARGEACGYGPRRDAQQTGEVKITDVSMGSPEMLMNRVPEMKGQRLDYLPSRVAVMASFTYGSPRAHDRG